MRRLVHALAHPGVLLALWLSVLVAFAGFALALLLVAGGAP